MNIKTIESLGNLSGKRVLLRADLNVPVEGGVVKEPFRIDSVLPTIETLVAKGAKVGIVSHIENEEGATLKPIFEYLKAKRPISFVKTLPELTAALASGKPGDVVLMENIRQYEGEKGNDLSFARELSAAADVYVNDAFSVCHREHASMVGVPRFLPAAAGPLLLKEVTELSKAFDAKKPLVVILGGAKFETKLPLIEAFIDVADTVFVGGALANDLLKARGNNVGKSKVGKEAPDLSGVMVAKNVLAPVDVVVTNAKGTEAKLADAVGAEDVIVDVGPQTTSLMQREIAKAAFVIWNGPLGWFEKGHTDGTYAAAKAIVAAPAHSLLGGGDTLAAIAPLNLNDKFTFVSTGGGAMLDFLGSKGKLSAIEPLSL